MNMIARWLGFERVDADIKATTPAGDAATLTVRSCPRRMLGHYFQILLEEDWIIHEIVELEPS